MICHVSWPLYRCSNDTIKYKYKGIEVKKCTRARIYLNNDGTLGTCNFLYQIIINFTTTKKNVKLCTNFFMKW